MPNDEPKWRRRKEARPGEIVDAALEVFAQKGFAAAKLDDIARRAGVSKGSLYLYFETKEDIFRAVARTAVASFLQALESQAEGSDAPFAKLAPRLLSRAAGMMEDGRVPAIARTVGRREAKRRAIKK
jgi:AcrR family transcriptional regulator